MSRRPGRSSAQDTLGRLSSARARLLSARWLEALAGGSLICVALVLVILFFERLPIEGSSLALDWKGLWLGMGGRQPIYTTGFRNPPWIALLLWPLGQLSFRGSWGVITLLTIAALVASVPSGASRPRRWLASLLLVTSYPALRHFADGNLEAVIIAGTLLLIHGYRTRNAWSLAAGILLASAKVQGAWLLLAATGAGVLFTWRPRQWLPATGLVAVVVVPCLLWAGPAWLGAVTGIPERGSIMDINIVAALSRLGAPFWLRIGAWILLASLTALVVWRSGFDLSREKAGLLITASLLLAPYAAGNSVLTVLAIGGVALLAARPWWGLVLFILADLLYVAPPAFLFDLQAYYWTALLLLAWVLLAARLRETWQYRVAVAQTGLTTGARPAGL